MTVGFEIDGRGALGSFQSLARLLQGAAKRAVREAVQAAEKHAKQTELFKDKSGETRGSIHGEVEGLSGFVEAGGAAGFLQHGTAPHLIIAHGQALRFEVAGQVMYRKMVQHPGTQPRPFMSEAAEAGQDVLREQLDLHVNEIIRRGR